MGFDVRSRWPGMRVPAMIIVAITAVLVLGLGAALPAQAQHGPASTDPEDLFMTNEVDLFDSDGNAFLIADEDELFGMDEDALFGGDELLMETPSSEPGKSLADDLLAGEGVEFGGRYSVGLSSFWDGLDPNASGKVDSRFDLGSHVYADVRPNKDMRLFAKARVDGGADLAKLDEFKLTPALTELFVDFHVNNRVFVRAGKQMIRWGVGYFFSPADIVNVDRIDPENPEADREGPVALKAHMPAGSNNYYVHVIVDDLFGPRPDTGPGSGIGSPGHTAAAGANSGSSDQPRVAFAPKAEWVVGGTEIGLGAYYRADLAPRGMMTVTGSLGKLGYFGEAVVSYGSDKWFLEADPDAPLGVRAVRQKDQLFARGTIGVQQSWRDPDGLYNITGAAQYYFNGEDLSRHHAALSLTWVEALGSRFSPGLFWMGDLQNNRGSVTASLGIKAWEKVRLSLGATHSYAEPGNATTMFVNFGYDDAF